MAASDHIASKGENAKGIFPFFSLPTELRNQIYAETTADLWITFADSRCHTAKHRHIAEHRHYAHLESAPYMHLTLVSNQFKREYEAEIARAAPHVQLKMELHVVPWLWARKTSSLQMALRRVQRVELTHRTSRKSPFDDWLMSCLSFGVPAFTNIVVIVDRKVNDSLSDFKRLVDCGDLPSLKYLEVVFLSSRIEMTGPSSRVWYRSVDFEPDKTRKLLRNVARSMPTSVDLACSVALKGWIYAPKVYERIFPAVMADTS